MQAVQDEPLQRRHLVQRQAFGLVEIGQGAQQIANGVAKLAIGVNRGLQDLFADPLVVRIVDQGHPQTQDVGAGFLDDGQGVGRIALGLGHLLPLLVEGEAVGQDRLERGAATGAAAFQQGRLEPAAVLVGAFQIEVGGPVGGTVAGVAVFRQARVQREGVGRTGVEPDVQDVFDLFIPGRVMRAQEVAVRRGEPDVGAVFGDGLDDPGVHLGVVQGLAGLFVDEHGERRAPGALAADQPVGPALDHRADAVLAGDGMEGGGVDGVQRRLTQGVAALQGLIHADEPLGRIAEDDRRLGAPAVRVGMLQPPARQEVAGLDQLFHHRAVGGTELAGLLALGLQHLQAREQRDAGVVGAVGIDGVGHLVMTVGLPDLEVVGAVAGRGVDEAGAGVVGDVVAGQQGHGEAVAAVERGQRVGGLQARRIDVVDTGPSGDLGGLEHLLGQLVGQDQAVAGLGPGRELQAFLHGRDLIQAIGDLGAIADGAVGRDGPGRGRPDDDGRGAGAEGQQVVGMVVRHGRDRELDPDRRADVVVVLDLGVGKRRALDRRPHDGL